MWRNLQSRHLINTRLSKRMHLILMLCMLAMGAVFRFVGYPTHRVAIVFAVPIVMGLVEYWLILRSDSQYYERVQRVMNVVGLVGLTLMVGVTGGLQGPLGPFLFLAALIPSLFYESVRYLIIQQTTVLIAVATLTALPEDLLGPTLPRTQHAILSASLACLGFFLIALRVRQVVRASQESLSELAQMREDKIAETSERLERLQGVSSRIAHELKNPLSAIKSLVQLTSRTVGDKERERLEVVQEEVVRMEVILRDYLSYSRPLLDLRVEPLRLDELLVQVGTVMSARAESSGIEFVIKTVPLTIEGDARRLKEAFINIIGNAIDACEKGDQISIWCEGIVLSESPHKGALIRVKDTGRGMSEEELTRVGTPFYTTRSNGTGLGVHLARGIFEQHGGSLRFESQTGLGTTTVITLAAQPKPLQTKLTPEEHAT